MKKTRIFSTMLATVICMASLPAINVFAANQHSGRISERSEK